MDVIAKSEGGAAAIPVDWSYVSIKEIAAKRPNAIVGGPFGSDLVSKDYVAAGVPVIRGQNMARRHVSGEFAFISKQKAKQLQANTAKPGDVVFTQRGTLGQVSLIPAVPYPEYVVSQSQMKVTLDQNAAVSAYVYQYFTSAFGQKQILESAIQTGVPHTNLGILRAYTVPLPRSCREQAVIAEALSDADELIDSLEQLIAKKCQIKQGAMQELLGGKRRLPGFEGVWDEFVIGDVADVIKGAGLSRSELSPSGSRPCLLYGELFTTYGRSISRVHSRTSSHDGVNSKFGDVLMPGSTTTSGIDLATASALLQENVALGGDINIIRQRAAKVYDPEFLSYLLTYVYVNEISELAQGITIHHLYGRDLKRLSIRLPSMKGQLAIRRVLLDFDVEISNIQQKLQKARRVKQGMMQELLTGRIRLV